MNRIDATIATAVKTYDAGEASGYPGRRVTVPDSLSADSIVARAEEKKAQADLAEAEMLRQHFDEQIAASRRRSPRCENENPGDGACDGPAADVCVHCGLALCFTGGCFDDVCAEAKDGKHLPSRKVIEAAVEKLADKMRMVG